MHPAAEADKAIALENDALDAMAIHAAIELIADRPPDAWFAKIRAISPGYGEAYARVARQLELHYRYEDAVTYYRKAIEADPPIVGGAFRARHRSDAFGQGRRSRSRSLNSATTTAIATPQP